jgi:hypothetical protein
MFHGGTNFGFMNGANHIVVNNTLSTPFYAADVTSYGLNLSYYNHLEILVQFININKSTFSSFV